MENRISPKSLYSNSLFSKSKKKVRGGFKSIDLGMAVILVSEAMQVSSKLSRRAMKRAQEQVND